MIFFEFVVVWSIKDLILKWNMISKLLEMALTSCLETLQQFSSNTFQHCHQSGWHWEYSDGYDGFHVGDCKVKWN